MNKVIDNLKDRGFDVDCSIYGCDFEARRRADHDRQGRGFTKIVIRALIVSGRFTCFVHRTNQPKIGNKEEGYGTASHRNKPLKAICLALRRSGERVTPEMWYSD